MPGTFWDLMAHKRNGPLSGPANRWNRRVLVDRDVQVDRH